MFLSLASQLRCKKFANSNDLHRSGESRYSVVEVAQCQSTSFLTPYILNGFKDMDLRGQTGSPTDPKTPFRPKSYVATEHLSTSLIIFNPKCDKLRGRQRHIKILR
jgi:hypothetical protein